MIAQRALALVRLAVALMALAAIGTQFSGSLDDPDKSIMMFWSEYTYQSNLVVAIVFLAGSFLLWLDVHPGRWWEMVRGAMVPFTATTFVVYRFLVEGTRHSADGIDYYAEWASDALHVWIPIVVLADWLIAPPETPLDYRGIAKWMVYPLAYCAYSLIRAPFVDWYPYNFLDPGEAGNYGLVALYVAAIAAGFAVLGLVVMWIGNTLRHWWPRHHMIHPLPAS